MALDRHTPEFLLDATHFQTDAETFNGLWVIKTLRRYEGEPHRLLDPLERAVAEVARQTGPRWGRPRGNGRLELAYLAFVFSRHPDVKPWWQTAGHSIWRSSGFDERPSYALCQRRFAELEHPAVIDAVEEVARTLIQLAVKGSDGRVGRYIHFDSTEAETHARLEHICPSGSPCWNGRPRSSRNGSGRVTAATNTSAVRAERHLRAADPEPETLAEDNEIGDAALLRRESGRLVVKVGSCWYSVLDSTAGIRAYTRGKKVKRFWVGFYNAKAIDHFVGAPLAVRITSASTNEFITYLELFAATVENSGQLPVAAIGDRGYSVSPVFEHNTRLGVASVMPWRAEKMKPDRSFEDTDLHDRHGVVRCKHCGAPTRFVSFARSAGAKRGKEMRGPRLYVQCILPVIDACKKRQSVGCDQAWRMLLPLWRDNPVYLALRNSHDRYERVHHHWRVRWRSGADDHSLRPKRRGRDNQQLRANAALLIEWLMICWREQWLPDSRPLGRPEPGRIIEETGIAHAEGLRELRSDLGLDQPYGSRAVALKVGGPKPVGLPSAEQEVDPSEPPESPLTDGELPGEVSDLDERLPGDAAEVQLDDLPF